jgi:hypothetical protein
MMKTAIVVTRVSAIVGQVTFAASWRTCAKNSGALVIQDKTPPRGGAGSTALPPLPPPLFV